MVHQGLSRRSLLAALPLLPACAQLVGPQPTAALAASAPAIPREFRAAWVATVANIDWPSRKGLSDAEQQQEVRAIVARAREVGLNALILQVRTSADALYASRLEPWSEYLSGTQGQAPGYDPLAYWIEQTHGAGLELHAWFNPYRARQLNAKSDEAPSHLANTQPGWVKRYGKQLWIDPGEPGAAQHSLAVFRDVLERYAVDGIHIDDYFYPYPEKNPDGTELDFPDEASYAAHGEGLPKADWRRRNVDRLVQAMHALVREVRPAARLGISPFGLMKPSERPEGILGFSQYDKLYADVELWLREGWLDYLVPQLYWPRAQTAQAFGPLLQGWMRLNAKAKPIWPGLYTSRITQGQAGGELQGGGDTRGWQPEEVSGQIALTRELNPGSGHVHFSMAALNQDRRGVVGHLRAQSYPEPALPPAFAELPDLPAPALALRAVDGGWRLEPAHEPAGPLVSWIQDPQSAHSLQRVWLWWREGGRWRGEWHAASATFQRPSAADALVASGINRIGMEGPRRAWKL
ncbi:MAG: family 10 glycosylhydrolase [Burkholderiales bacterium]|nr:family 10 glycosylhydrolase [Burkholderiales bacterium]